MPEGGVAPAAGMVGGEDGVGGTMPRWAGVGM